MQELIKIENKPAILTINFDELKTRLATELERYDVVVTEDTVADAKKLATELNQTAKFIDDRRKQEVAAVSEPIRKFDEQMKELVSMCKDGRQKILEQVKTFEDETREKAYELLTGFLRYQWDEMGVDKEFRRAKIDDLVMLTAVTKTGNLAARASNEVKSRVQADRALQDRTTMRLVKLENISYQAGLSAPLTRDHVAGFLFADDEKYDAEIARIIDAEKKREELAQQRMREKWEREEQQRQERERAQKEMAERAQAQSQEQDDPVSVETTVEEQPEEQEHHNGDQPQHRHLMIVATFDVGLVPASLTDERLIKSFRERIEADGYSTLSHVVVRSKAIGS